MSVRDPAPALLAALLLAGAPVPGPAGLATAQEEPVVVLEPEERARALQLFLERVRETVVSGQLEGYLALWADDGTVFEPGAPPATGPAAVRDAWGGLLRGRCECRFELVEVQDPGTGEWAYVRADLAGLLVPPGEAPRVFDDELLLVTRLGPDGIWRISRQLRTRDRRRHRAASPSVAPPAGVEVTEGVVYATPGGFPLRLDLFQPAADVERPAPAVVLVHGGSWSGGARQQLRPYAAALAGRGFVTVSIEYRLSGEAPYPAAVEDARAAVEWLRGDAARLGVDPERIAIGGVSAGAQIAGLVAMAPPPGDEPTVQAAILVSPALDLEALGERYPEPPEIQRALLYYLGASYAERPELWARASPLRHADRHDPPTLLLHGSEDAVTPPSQSLEMLSRLTAEEVYADLFTARHGGHLFFLEEVWFPVAVEKMASFLDRVLRTGELPSATDPG